MSTPTVAHARNAHASKGNRLVSEADRRGAELVRRLRLAIQAAEKMETSDCGPDPDPDGLQATLELDIPPIIWQLGWMASLVDNAIMTPRSERRASR